METWQRLYNQGREPPKEFFEQPEIPRHLTALWMAFGELSTERPAGMGIAPIPVSKIKQYLSEEFGLEGDQHERALMILRTVDGAYVSMSNGVKDPDEDRTRELVKATDTAGVKRLVRGLGKKKPREPRVK